MCYLPVMRFSMICLKSVEVSDLVALARGRLSSRLARIMSAHVCAQPKLFSTSAAAVPGGGTVADPCKRAEHDVSTRCQHTMRLAVMTQQIVVLSRTDVQG